jgi:putative nucleotidyltransferase with HDIG domain
MVAIIVRADTERLLRRCAFDVEGFPVRVDLWSELVHLLSSSDSAAGPAIDLIETGVPVTAGVLRAANRSRRARGTIATVPEALAILDRPAALAAVERMPTYDIFEPPAEWQMLPEQLRLHSVAVAGTLERLVGGSRRNDLHYLRAAAILHDIGKVLLTKAFPEASSYSGDVRTPDQRLDYEREVTGTDHAAVGGWLLRHWRLPEQLAAAVEQHHSPEDGSDAAILQLADMLVHFAAGGPVDPLQLSVAGEAIGLSRVRLSRLIYELTDALKRPERKSHDQCPLSSRELDVLRLLARGMVYKQIAADLDLSPSTVRSHLHRIYKRLNVVDRTQAVLMATELDWI